MAVRTVSDEKTQNDFPFCCFLLFVFICYHLIEFFWNMRLGWSRLKFVLSVVALQEPYLITKLESAEKTWKELSVWF